MRHPVASMSSTARRALVARVTPRYLESSLAQKRVLLDTFVTVTGYSRKHAIALLNHEAVGQPTIRCPRLSQYGPEVQQALFLAWQAADHICAKRLIPFLPDLVAALERHGRLQLSEERRTQLFSVSVATAERFLRTQRQPTRHGLCTTKAGTLLKGQIPIRTFHEWNKARPGFLEADLVAHCGGHTEGSYVYTLTLTDIATGWTECLPVLTRSPEAVLAAFSRARTLIPFPVLGLDTDNGAEFINEEVLAYCTREQITFTRGRPYQHNDQACVEQKNGAIVRQVVGYDRLVGYCQLKFFS